MNYYITKPIAINELEFVLTEFCKNKKDSVPEIEVLIPFNFQYIKDAFFILNSEMKFSENLITKFSNSYADSVSDLLSKLKEGIDNNNFEMIECACHDIKSGAATLKLDLIRDIAKSMEDSARKKISFDYLNGYKTIIQYTDILKDFLNK